jgi:hypothetical protein
MLTEEQKERILAMLPDPSTVERKKKVPDVELRLVIDHSLSHFFETCRQERMQLRRARIEGERGERDRMRVELAEFERMERGYD